MSKLFSEACLYIPGGVNSPVRSFKNVIDDPVFIKRAFGSKLVSEKDLQYIDFMCSWGAIIAGHANQEIHKAIVAAAEDGVSFGAVTKRETAMAKTICSILPTVEQVRFVNSGTEACMSAIRLARGYTGRKYVVKFEGCYHGHADSLLVKAGSGSLSFGVPDSEGVPDETASLTITIPYNDTEALYQCFDKHGMGIAAVIIEPIAGNMNMIPATKEFLQLVRNVCTEYDSILIFDEVMSGFRVALGGAQSIYTIYPDLVCLGKVIGGGMPVGAFGGKKEIMEMLSPNGPVYQAGTLSGNPVAIAAGLAVFSIIQKNNFFYKLERITKSFVDGLIDVAQENGVSFSARSIGGMFGMFFTKEAPQSFAEVRQSNEKNFRLFFHTLLKNNIYTPPSLYEASFITSAHTEHDIEQALKAADAAFKIIKQN